MKHSLREYEAEALRLSRSTRELLRNFRSHEAKRDVTFPCGEATLHRAKPCFMSCFATLFMRVSALHFQTKEHCYGDEKLAEKRESNANAITQSSLFLLYE